MNRRRLPWLLSIALIAVGSVTAHTLGYLAFVGSGERGDEIAESSHGLAAHGQGFLPRFLQTTPS